MGFKITKSEVKKRGGYTKSRIGSKNPFYGKHHSEETKLKMRKPKSLETRLKMSLARKGKTYEQIYGEEVAKIRKQQISNQFKGKKKLLKTRLKMKKPKSEEHKLKISKSLKGKVRNKNWCKNISEGKKGGIPWNKGKSNVFTEETLNKIREARAKQIFPIKDTKIELKIQSYLEQLGVDYFTHRYMDEIKHAYQCDIWIPCLNMVIECDGDYWHKYPVGNEIDHIRTQELISKGFKVLRLWEHEINIMDIFQFKERIGGIND